VCVCVCVKWKEAGIMADLEATLLTHLVALERRIRDQDEEILALQLARGLDIESSKREMMDGARAKELLGNPKNDTTTVRLCSKSFGTEAAAEAKRVLSGLKAVTRADLSDIIAGRPEVEALEVLKTIVGSLPADKLNALDLSENALGEKGVRALMSQLSEMKHLKEVKFMNNGLSELSVALLEQSLPTQELETLHFHNNMSGSGGAKAAAKIVMKTPHLSDFRMSSSRVRADGGIELLRAISVRAPTIRRLNLSDSMFDSACTNELVTNLAHFAHLTDLVLRDTGISKQPLLKALLVSGTVPELAVLDLSGLELSEKDGATIGKIALQRPRLRKLWMDDNELESVGVKLFCKHAGKDSAIETISVQTNQIGKIGALALAQFALTHKSVKMVELNDNQISEDAVAKIKTMIGEKLGNLDENNQEDDPDESDDDEEDDEVDRLASAIGSKLAV
jgi:Ran GTPase-activating protein 1